MVTMHCSFSEILAAGKTNHRIYHMETSGGERKLPMKKLVCGGEFGP